VNDFINRRIEFDDDMSIYNYSDYWATPLEPSDGPRRLRRFAIIKYFSLKDAGIPFAKLRSGVCQGQARRTGWPAPAGPHGAGLLRHTECRTAGTRQSGIRKSCPPHSADLQPVFSFNSEAVWNGVAGNSAKGKGGTGQLSRWQDLC
jgi:hypothetical protein